MSYDRQMIYLAAPLFNEREREFNLALAQRFEAHVSVFLPQRDGSLLIDMVRAGVPVEVAERRVFEQDRYAMTKANALVAVLDGGYIDEGVAFELGFMVALGRPCVGLQSDIRRALPSGNNPMISQALQEIFACVDGVTAWVARLAATNAGQCSLSA